MRIVVVGAGGVGGYFGGKLAASGAADVAFLARGAQLAALRSRGLTVRGVAGEFSVSPVEASDDPAEIGPVDLVLFCVKTYHVPEAAPALAPLVGPHTTLLPLQNGVETPSALAALYGWDKVLGGLVYVAAAILEPGVIVSSSQVARLVFGELDGRPSARTEAFLACCHAAGIEAEVSPDVRAAMWQKFLFICAMAGLTAATRRPIGPILATPEARDLLRETMEEVEALAALEEVRLPADAVDQALETAHRFTPETKSSLLVDLERGNPLELEALNGAVVRLASRHGLPTPVNRTLYGLIKAAAQGSSA